jgi:hypothetical protein
MDIHTDFIYVLYSVPESRCVIRWQTIDDAPVGVKITTFWDVMLLLWQFTDVSEAVYFLKLVLAYQTICHNLKDYSMYS